MLNELSLLHDLLDPSQRYFLETWMTEEEILFLDSDEFGMLLSNYYNRTKED